MKSQAMFRVNKNKENPYVMLNKGFLNDNRLTWKAKGILAYLLSLPDDWQIFENELQEHSWDNTTSLNTGIKELIEVGYIERKRTRDDKGHLMAYKYCVYEVSTKSGFSKVGKTKIGKTKAGKTPTTNTNPTNNNLTNIKEEEESTSKIFLSFSETKSTKLTKSDEKILLNFIQDFGSMLVEKGIEEMSLRADRKSLNYLKSTLEDWKLHDLKDIEAINNYLEGKKTVKPTPKPKTSTKNSFPNNKKPNDTFNDFPQRDYDYDDLEKKLTGEVVEEVEEVEHVDNKAFIERMKHKTS